MCRSWRQLCFEHMLHVSAAPTHPHFKTLARVENKTSGLIIAMEKILNCCFPSHTPRYFLLTAATLKEPDWPSAYAEYTLFEASPAAGVFGAAEVAQVKKDVPGSRVIAYFDSQNAPIKKGCSCWYVLVAALRRFVWQLQRWFRPSRA